MTARQRLTYGYGDGFEGAQAESTVEIFFEETTDG